MLQRELKGKIKYLTLIAVFSIVVYAFFSISFMFPKIKEAYNKSLEIEEVLNRSGKTGKAYSAGRLGGFYLALKNIESYPLFGSGGNTSLAFGRSEGDAVYAVNGIAGIMISYGLFGLIVYFFLITKSSGLLSVIFRSRSKYAFLILLLISFVGFNLQANIIMFTFLFFGYFLKSDFDIFLNKRKQVWLSIKQTDLFT